MARLDYIRHGGEVAERIRQRRGGRLTALDGMLLHSPPVADGWNSLLGAIRTSTTLDPAVRELAILRVAAWNDAPYEWRAHEKVARQAGLGDEQLAALRTGTATGTGTAAGTAAVTGMGTGTAADGRAVADEASLAALTGAQRAALGYTDAMTRHVRVSDGLFASLHEHFDDRQIVELTATVAAYNLVSRFLVALEVGEEPADDAQENAREDAGGSA